MQKKEKLPKGERVRPVDSLFPKGKLVLTNEELRPYQRPGQPFAFCIDRQSIPKNATEDGATGMKRRVSAILGMAESLKLYVPPPLPLVSPVPGQLPYSFADDCEPFWFVDGTTKRATGYAVNEHARPRLWRAFKLVQALNEAGCAPQAFLIGEGTRFFRDESWLTMFVKALWNHGIEFHDGLFGRVDRYNLSGYAAYITALSGWLGMVGQGARKARRSDHRIFHRQPPFGLVFNPTRDRVFAVAETWPVLEELVEQFWDGRIKTTLAAAQWMGQVGHPRTQAWVVRLLHGPILDGLYRSYETKYESRLLREAAGILQDLDITPGGYRRWLITAQPGEEWHIEFPDGTRPIDPIKLRAVRARLFRAQGRPTKKAPPVGRLIEPRMLRCAHCGHTVAETTDFYPNGTPRPWHLTCRAVPVLRTTKTCSVEEAKALIPDHPRYRLGHASGPIWERLAQGFRNAALTDEEPPTDPDAEFQRLQSSLTLATQQFEQYQEWVRAGHEGDMNDSHIAVGVNKKRAALSAQLTTAHQLVEAWSNRRLTEQRLNTSVREASEALRWLTELDLTDDVKRDIIEQVVDHVDIDLGTGEFVIHVQTTHADLQALRGRLDPPENIITGSRTGYNICLCLRGRLAA